MKCREREQLLHAMKVSDPIAKSAGVSSEELKALLEWLSFEDRRINRLYYRIDVHIAAAGMKRCIKELNSGRK